MNVTWSPESRDELAEIRTYIATDNPQRAISFVMEITAAGEAIADTPLAFPLVPRLEHKGIRKRNYGQYLIFYNIEAQNINIIHVAHGSRDYVRALFSNG